MHHQHSNDTGTYIVTGASSGIGKATAIALAQRNRKVLAVARRQHLLDALARQYPQFITTLSADLADANAIEQLALAAQELGNILGVVHAAGTLIDLANYQQADTQKLLDGMAVHVAAPMALNNRLGDHLSGARVMYIDSHSASNLRVGWASYSIIKSAAQMAARAAAEELIDSIVIRVFPGAVDTPLVASVLASTNTSPTVDTFRKLEANGEMTSPSIVGDFLANILTRATKIDLHSRSVWDINNPDDQIFD